MERECFACCVACVSKPTEHDMASIGFIPTKMSVEVREPDGDAGTIPAASRAAAGVMTAQQVAMLEEVFQWFKTHAGTGAPIVIERASDMSQYPTRLEIKQLLSQAMPRVIDTTPEVVALRAQLGNLSEQIRDAARGPTTIEIPEGIDTHARTILEAVIDQMENYDTRLRRVEATLDQLGIFAETRAKEAEEKGRAVA